MSRHVILGKGNLGADLAHHLKKAGHEVLVLSKSTGWDYPCSLHPVHEFGPDVIWNCLGAGSVEEGKKFIDMQLIVHVGLTTRLLDEFADVPQFHFSSNYSPDGNFDAIPVTNYAMTKHFMEEMVLFKGKRHHKVIRVANLYGYHKPKQTLMYKLAKAALSGEVNASANIVAPTSTDWLAHRLTKYELLLSSPKRCFDAHGKNYSPAFVLAASFLKGSSKVTINNTGYTPGHPSHLNARCDEFFKVVWGDHPDILDEAGFFMELVKEGRADVMVID